MKKLIAALIGVPITLASVGDDVVRFFASYADDVARVASNTVQLRLKVM
ncbi:MAG: hypothetical protein KME22_13215 [Hassallia sp. WJT32-NPBG1]|jgi:hypothetical protein|nr:hypothetical protein [Hassallia sp. WJT32-NPBG1]